MVNDLPWNQWQNFHSPRLAEVDAIDDALLEWNDPSIAREQKRVLLVTVLRNHQTLRLFNELLGRIASLEKFARSYC